MQWSSFVRDIIANDPRHISVKAVEYRSCANFFSSPAQKAKSQTCCYLKQGFFLFECANLSEERQVYATPSRVLAFLNLADTSTFFTELN